MVATSRDASIPAIGFVAEIAEWDEFLPGVGRIRAVARMLHAI
jgi:hypothetical protein